MKRPVETRRESRGGGVAPAKVDLLPIEKDSEKKEVAKTADKNSKTASNITFVRFM